MKAKDYPHKKKEEYLEEIQTALSAVETYKVRYFYIFILEKLKMDATPGGEGGAVNE